MTTFHIPTSIIHVNSRMVSGKTYSIFSCQSAPFDDIIGTISLAMTCKHLFPPWNTYSTEPQKLLPTKDASTGPVVRDALDIIHTKRRELISFPELRTTLRVIPMKVSRVRRAQQMIVGHRVPADGGHLRDTFTHTVDHRRFL